VAADANSSALLYFSTAEQAVEVAGKLLAAHDWSTLARYYDLSLTPQVQRDALLDGRFFFEATTSRTAPGTSMPWRQPFAPGAKFTAAKPVGDPNDLPCIWTLTTTLTVEQGGGQDRPVVRETRLLRTEKGFQLLPSAPVEPARPPPVVSDAAWQARGADPILLFRPDLQARADREVPAGRSSNIPALVQAIERLKPIAAQHPGRSQPGTPALGEPPTVYVPTDDELLLSLAGDRIWRSLRIAPPGTLASVREKNPGWSPGTVQCPHIEIVRAAVAGSGLHVFALPPVTRPLKLGE
jgi:hypothetical protein